MWHWTPLNALRGSLQGGLTDRLQKIPLSRDAKLKALRNLYSYRWEEIREKRLEEGQHWERENGKKGGLDIWKLLVMILHYCSLASR